MQKLLILLSLISNVDPKTIHFNEHDTVNIRGVINSESSNKFIKDLNEFNHDELHIFINSPGGSVMEGMKIISHIDMLNDTVKINCIADFAASMAFIIFQNCHNRYVLSSSILMQHQMSLGLEGNLFNINSYMKMIQNLNMDLDTKQATRLQLTYDEFVDKIRHDWWITGSEAIKENVADDLVKVKCSQDLYKKKEIINYESLFGNVILEFYKCPLLRKPTSSNTYDEFLSENYINGKLHIKSYY